VAQGEQDLAPAAGRLLHQLTLIAAVESGFHSKVELPLHLSEEQDHNYQLKKEMVQRQVRIVSVARPAIELCPPQGSERAREKASDA